jgi:hypothetical protein
MINNDRETDINEIPNKSIKKLEISEHNLSKPAVRSNSSKNNKRSIIFLN